MASRADLIITGRIASLAGETGFGWVEALAIADGRVLARGRRAEIEALAGPGSRRLELSEDLVVLPSVTDAHLHLVDAALAEDQLDLEGVPSLEAALALVARVHGDRLAAGDHDGWLLGHGWTFDGWTTRPTAAALERAAPGRRIALWAHDHHTRWLSEAALAALAIDRETSDPVYGRLGRLTDGRPDGLLFEGAAELAAGRIPRPDTAAVHGAIERYAGRLAALGVTGLHDPGVLADASGEGLEGSSFELQRAMAMAGRLPLRVHAGLGEAQLEAALAAGLASGGRMAPPADADPPTRASVDRFRVGWLKLFADGSLGSRTAALSAPYTDAEANPGPDGPAGSPAPFAELVEPSARAARGGIATMIHAIGDAAVTLALDVFASIPPDRRRPGGLAPRIEHAQVVRPDDRTRFAGLGVVASMQPIQLRSDEPTMRLALGERIALAFPAASIAAVGTGLAFGTDAPVEPPDPWPGMAVAVTRWAPEWGADAPVSAPEEAISVEAAIRAATVGPWSAAGSLLGGRLVAGAPADLVVVDLPSPEAETAGFADALRVARPLLTLLDGSEVHRAPGFDR